MLLALALMLAAVSAGADSISKVRTVDPEDLIRIDSPDGWLFLEGAGQLVFPPGANTVILPPGRSGGSHTLVLADPGDESTFFTAGELAVSGAINVTAYGQGDSAVVILYEAASDELVIIDRGAGRQDRFDASALRIAGAQGVTSNPSTGQVYILDTPKSRIISIAPDSDGNYDIADAIREGRVEETEYSPDLARIRGLAFNPAGDSLITASAGAGVLFELSQDGSLQKIHQMQGVDVSNLSGLAIAPSLDNTDDPAKLHLFIAIGNRVTEYSLGSENGK